VLLDAELAQLLVGEEPAGEGHQGDVHEAEGVAAEEGLVGELALQGLEDLDQVILRLLQCLALELPQPSLAVKELMMITNVKIREVVNVKPNIYAIV